MFSSGKITPDTALVISSTLIEYLPEDKKRDASIRLKEIQNFRDIGLPNIQKTNLISKNLLELQAYIVNE